MILLLCGCSNEYVTKMTSSNDNAKYSASSEYNDIMLANVRVINEEYNSFMGLKYSEHNTYGSGVIFEEDEMYYYALTNNHVVDFSNSYSKNELYIEDYYNNRYNAEIVISDSSYDLAIIRFSKEISLKELDIKMNNSIVGENIKTLGNPNKLKNVITEGVVSCYNSIKLDDSDVNFNILVHNAEIANGSSGGALLNENDEIIGITFAGVFDKKGNFITGYAIPSEKIIEFINENI